MEDDYRAVEVGGGIGRNSGRREVAKLRPVNRCWKDVKSISPGTNPNVQGVMPRVQLRGLLAPKL
jgi:hypothetical protein